MPAIPTILKVFGLSLAIALLIKYAIAPLTIPSNNALVLLLVSLPTLLVGGWLGVKLSRQSEV
jgi:hypothetical protein